MFNVFIIAILSIHSLLRSVGIISKSLVACDLPYIHSLGHPMLYLLPFGIFSPSKRLTLPHTLSATLTGSLLPFNLWSISHIPTQNSSRLRLLCPRTFTSAHTSSRTVSGSLLLRHISLTTIFSTSPLNASTLLLGAGRSSPRFAAHTPSYRFRSRSVRDMR